MTTGKLKAGTLKSLILAETGCSMRNSRKNYCAENKKIGDGVNNNNNNNIRAEFEIFTC